MAGPSPGISFSEIAVHSVDFPVPFLKARGGRISSLILRHNSTSNDLDYSSFMVKSMLYYSPSDQRILDSFLKPQM